MKIYGRITVAMSRQRPVAIDLFSGAGGLSEGLLAAGFDVAVAVEKHPHAALTCAFNHPNTKVICDDITRINRTNDCLKSFVEERTGSTNVDLVAAAPPCQGFSPAGLQDRNDPRNSLFLEFLRVVRYCKPRLLLFENVPGFVKQYKGQAVKQLVKQLRGLGYHLKDIPDDEAGTLRNYPYLNAAGFGVPQRRKRFIMVGWLTGTLAKEFQWPTETHGSDPSQQNYVTVREALNDLAFLKLGLECHVHRWKPQSDYQANRRKNATKLFNHLSTQHRPSTTRMFARIDPGQSIRSIPRCERSGKQTMSKMHPEAISKVILGLPDDIIHYSLNRIPTVREMARLQSFDDDFVFLGRRTTCDKYRREAVPQYTQVGNAVPPLLAYELGIALLRSLGKRKKELRDLKTRGQRHEWLRGSSGYAGYTLDEEAEAKLDLVDCNGNRMELPISNEEKRVTTIRGTKEWMSRAWRTKTSVRINGRKSKPRVKTGR